MRKYSITCVELISYVSIFFLVHRTTPLKIRNENQQLKKTDKIHNQTRTKSPQTIQPMTRMTPETSSKNRESFIRHRPKENTDYNDIYLDTKNAAAYSSNVKAFVSQKSSISLHKKRIRNFTRRQIIVPGPYHSVSWDLIDYSMYGRQNSGYKFILSGIDMFSRFVYARPLQNKTAEHVASNIDDIISKMQFVPRFFTSDKGKRIFIKHLQILINLKEVNSTLEIGLFTMFWWKNIT